MIILGLIAVFSFFIMHFIEMASFGSRVAGRVTNRVALGTTLQLSIVTLSRFFLIPFLPVLGYLVESGILIEDYLIIVIATYILTFLMSIIILFKLNAFQYFFQKVFSNYDHKTIPTALLKTVLNYDENFKTKPCERFSLERIVVKKTFVSFIAYIFLITGFFVAFMLAILYPEYRLTLSQFTATFHGIGAIIVAVYLDPMLSRSIDHHDDEITWINNVYSIILGRVLSYLLIILALSIFLVIKML
jgi:hypothetical protein